MILPNKQRLLFSVPPVPVEDLGLWVHQPLRSKLHLKENRSPKTEAKDDQGHPQDSHLDGEDDNGVGDVDYGAGVGDDDDDDDDGDGQSAHLRSRP